MRFQQILEYKEDHVRDAEQIVWELIVPKLNDQTPWRKARSLIVDLIINKDWDNSYKTKVFTAAHDVLYDAYHSGKLGESLVMEYKDKTDTKFMQWFGNSKVVDPGGDPLMVYHGTLFGDEIKSFHDLSHFGTIGSANQRIDDILKLHKDFPASRSMSHPEPGQERPHIYPVFLKIENPFKIVDCGDWHWDDVWDQIISTDEYYRNKIIEQLVEDYGQEEVEDEIYDMEEDTIHERRLVEYLVAVEESPWEFLKSLGHDGIVYVNKHEDAGNTSWVPFSGKQVMSAL